MERPRGVNGLAGIAFTAAAIGTVLGIAFLFFLWLRRQGRTWGWDDISQADAFVGAFACLAVAALFYALGRGLLNLRAWARTSVLIMAWPGLAYFVFWMIAVLILKNPYWIISFVILLILAAVAAGILVYLSRPHVKESFSAVPSTRPASHKSQ